MGIPRHTAAKPPRIAYRPSKTLTGHPGRLEPSRRLLRPARGPGGHAYAWTIYQPGEREGGREVRGGIGNHQGGPQEGGYKEGDKEGIRSDGAIGEGNSIFLYILLISICEFRRVKTPSQISQIFSSPLFHHFQYPPCCAPSWGKCPPENESGKPPKRPINTGFFGFQCAKLKVLKVVKATPLKAV
jgi:hypothetical protein